MGQKKMLEHLHLELKQNPKKKKHFLCTIILMLVIKYNKHPFYDAVRKYLVNFNDYYVENWHSHIRANTNSQSSSKNIIRQTLMLDDHEQILVNTFKNLNTYPYTGSDLDYLINRASLFLIEYFHSLYNEQNQTMIRNRFILQH
jgi:hypothetical protein